MPAEAQDKRTIAFVDGQNLYYAAKQAFGYTYSNCDTAPRSVIDRHTYDACIDPRDYRPKGTP
jgi:hypothetical protein